MLTRVSAAGLATGQQGMPHALQNKLVVLTTEWLYHGCRQAAETVVCFGIRDELHKATQGAAAQFTLQPQYTDNHQNICEGVINECTQSCS